MDLDLVPAAKRRRQETSLDKDIKERTLIPHPILQPSIQLYMHSDYRLAGSSVNNATFQCKPTPLVHIFASSVKEFVFANTISTFQEVQSLASYSFPIRFSTGK